MAAQISGTILLIVFFGILNENARDCNDSPEMQQKIMN